MKHKPEYSQVGVPGPPHQALELSVPLQRKISGIPACLMLEKKSLFDAVTEVDQEARERQAEEVPAGAPEGMPGLAAPGMGAEAPMAPPPQAGGGGIEALLAQLGG